MTTLPPDRIHRDLQTAAWAGFGFAIYVLLAGLAVASVSGGGWIAVIPFGWFALLLPAALQLNLPLVTASDAWDVTSRLMWLVGWSVYILHFLWTLASYSSISWIRFVLVGLGVLLFLWCGYRYVRAFIAAHAVWSALRDAQQPGSRAVMPDAMRESLKVWAGLTAFAYVVSVAVCLTSLRQPYAQPLNALRQAAGVTPVSASQSPEYGGGRWEDTRRPSRARPLVHAWKRIAFSHPDSVESEIDAHRFLDGSRRMQLNVITEWAEGVPQVRSGVLFEEGEGHRSIELGPAQVDSVRARWRAKGASIHPATVLDCFRPGHLIQPLMFWRN